MRDDLTPSLQDECGDSRVGNLGLPDESVIEGLNWFYDQQPPITEDEICEMERADAASAAAERMGGHEMSNESTAIIQRAERTVTADAIRTSEPVSSNQKFPADSTGRVRAVDAVLDLFNR